MKSKLKQLFSGRVGRKRFLKGLCFLISISLLVFIAYSFLDSYIFYPGSYILNLIFWFIIVPIYFLVYISLLVRRLHDTGSTGWWVVVFFVPLINFAFFLYLVFDKGDDNENGYGSVSQNTDFLVPYYSEQLLWPLTVVAIAVYIAVNILL